MIQPATSPFLSVPAAPSAERALVTVIPVYNESLIIGSVVLQTRQHIDRVMVADDSTLNRVFFGNLEQPKPKYNPNIGFGTPAEHTGKTLSGIEKPLIQENLDNSDIPRSVIAGLEAARWERVLPGHFPEIAHSREGAVEKGEALVKNMFNGGSVIAKREELYRQVIQYGMMN